MEPEKYTARLLHIKGKKVMDSITCIMAVTVDYIFAIG